MPNRFFSTRWHLRYSGCWLLWLLGGCGLGGFQLDLFEALFLWKLRSAGSLPRSGLRHQRLSWGAYVLVRHLEKKRVKNIDGEKILSLSAYTSGVLLLIFALFIVIEAVERFFSPVEEIRYAEAMIVAIVGMAVNIVCAFVLHDAHGNEDYNRRSAYLHVLADALTSLGAIFGLICAKIWNIIWIDTAVAFVCSLFILRWAVNLLIDTGKVLTSCTESQNNQYL